MTIAKRKILIFNKFYLPGYKAGGPIRSIANIVESLGEKFDFFVVTTDRDSFEELEYNNILVNQWNEVGKAKVFYISPDHLKFCTFLKLMKQEKFDAVYLNSYFNLFFSTIPLIIMKFFNCNIRNIVLAPRGEFSPGALQLKASKKKLFIKTFKFLGIYKNIEWQASSNFEKDEILDVMGELAKNITIAPNIPSHKISSEALKTEYKKDTLDVVFLSRISEKKNLDLALRVLHKYKQPLNFNIYGVVDDQPFWQKCLEQIKGLPANITVKYHGVVSHNEVADCLRNNHIFFLPTKGENYGHAIVESFIVGTPVLISDTTPWRGLSKVGVGWDLPLNSEDKFLEVLVNYHECLKKNAPILREHISNWIIEKLDVSEVIKLNENLFN